MWKYLQNKYVHTFLNSDEERVFGKRGEDMYNTENNRQLSRCPSVNMLKTATLVKPFLSHKKRTQEITVILRLSAFLNCKLCFSYVISIRTAEVSKRVFFFFPTETMRFCYKILGILCDTVFLRYSFVLTDIYQLYSVFGVVTSHKHEPLSLSLPKPIHVGRKWGAYAEMTNGEECCQTDLSRSEEVKGHANDENITLRNSSRYKRHKNESRIECARAHIGL